MKHKNFQIHHEDHFARNAQGISKIYHEVLLLMKFPQTKPQIKNMKNNYYDLYYTVIKTRDENRDIDNQYENDEKKIILVLTISFLIIVLGLKTIMKH